MLDRALIGKLGEIAGKANVLAGAENVERYGTDGTGLAPGAPYVVVAPRDAGEVAGIVEVALAEGLPVVARGGGTGLRGGAVPVKGGIVVSAERMNAGPDVRREDLYLVVGAGAVTADLRKRAEAENLLFPIDPASQASSTIGGNIGDAAVGMHGLKYGEMRNYVLGLEVVTPEGKILTVGAKTVKSVAGYDLTRLMVGAQGILSIVTSATLKVLPLPEERRVVAFACSDGAAAAAAAAEIVAEGFNPAALEIADCEAVAAGRALAAGAPAGDHAEDRGHSCDAEVLVEFHGPRSLCGDEASRVKELMAARYKAKTTGEAAYPEGEGLWKIRRAVLGGLAAVGQPVTVMDLVLPRGRMEGMVKEIAGISRRHRTRIAVFGHAGEGRLHAAVLFRERGAGDAAMSEVMSACVNSGGVAAADKRMGQAGAGLPRAQLSEAGREVMWAVKRAFDPEGIMNPGKLLHER